MTSSNTFQILCFGDSLTAGFSCRESNDHPYALALKYSLGKKCPQLGVSIDIHGLEGDQIISPQGHFLPRIKRIYQGRTRVPPYDIAIILGGTNDICRNRLAKDIWPALKEVLDVPISHGTIVLLLTVPEFGFSSAEIELEREALNSIIMSHEAENFYTFDLSKAVPYWGISEEEREILWQDVIHFTKRGYDRVGELLAERLAEIITTYQTDAARTRD